MKFGLLGNGMDRMPDAAFKMMAFIFRIREIFTTPDKLLEEFHIEEGQTVIDYGCGPGLYISKASRLVGDTGSVMAVDIHELAIEAIQKKVLKENLSNVTGHVAVNGKCPLPDNTADMIYALDMFHMVSDPESFLTELNRISKPDGTLFIDNGHQPREEARDKILASGKWNIVAENERYMKCEPSN